MMSLDCTADDGLFSDLGNVSVMNWKKNFPVTCSLTFQLAVVRFTVITGETKRTSDHSQAQSSVMLGVVRGQTRLKFKPSWSAFTQTARS